MEYQIAIYSSDAVFTRMLELEFLMRGKSVYCAAQPSEDLFSEIVLLDLDSCTPPAPNTYGRMIGFTAQLALVADEVRRQCSMVLHRPFEMRLLRREIFSAEEELLYDPHMTDAGRAGKEQKHRLAIDSKRSVFTVDGSEIVLSPNELRVMQCLLEKRGEAVSRESLSQRIGESCANKVDVYVCYLRRKLDQVLEVPLIRTVRGKGYKIK